MSAEKISVGKTGIETYSISNDNGIKAEGCIDFLFPIKKVIPSIYSQGSILPRDIKERIPISTPL